MEQYYGLVGVPLLFAFVFVWTQLEERFKARAKRKYDKQMAKYDTWRDKIDRV
jgi:hypothetical protein|tara:strand:- start:526 stop:684 length:159 start_codon:yes stop_codon:yes gene_type:complete